MKLRTMSANLSFHHHMSSGFKITDSNVDLNTRWTEKSYEICDRREKVVLGTTWKQNS